MHLGKTKRSRLRTTETPRLHFIGLGQPKVAIWAEALQAGSRLTLAIYKAVPSCASVGCRRGHGAASPSDRFVQ